MASNLNVKTRVSTIGTYSNQIGNGDNAQYGFSIKQDITLTDGTVDDQANRIWTSQGRSLADTASSTIDVYDFAGEDIGAGDGKDPFGQTMLLAEVVMLLVKNTSPSTGGDLVVGGDGTTAAWNSIFNGSDTAEAVVQPGGALMIQARYDGAYAVADITNHLLKLSASGGAVTYDVVIAGRNA